MKDRYVEHIIRKADFRDRHSLSELARRLSDAGWASRDIASYLLHTEEINPELPECVALNKMRQLREKYNG
jgi:hypothetical protein